jgi:hypothetical protein
MQTLTLEFDSQADLDDATRHLWDRLGVTGELVAKPLPDGRWRLQVVSEKPLRGPTLEKLRGRRVED